MPPCLKQLFADGNKYIRRDKNKWVCTVKLTRINFYATKTFNDTKYNGEESSLLKAKEWRSKQIKTINKKLISLEKGKLKLSNTERTINIYKTHENKCRLPIAGEDLMVLSFSNFKEACIKRQTLNEKSFHINGKFTSCQNCEVGIKIKLGKRKTLPSNVKIMNTSSLDLKYPISKTKKTIESKKKLKYMDIKILNNLDVTPIEVHTNVNISESLKRIPS